MDFAGCFIKFGEFQHIVDLQKQGILYFNPLNFFTKIEDNYLRGDCLENVIDMIYMEKGEVILGKPDELPIVNGTKMQFVDARINQTIDEPYGNLFCLYKINVLDKPLGQHFFIDSRVKDFGEYFLLIHDGQGFLKKVKKAIKKLKIFYKADIVKYLDFSKYTGKKNVFQKDIKYEYQQEYRIFIKNNILEPVTIKIGNISKISVIGKTESIEKMVVAASSKDNINNITYTIFSNLQKV